MQGRNRLLLADQRWQRPWLFLACSVQGLHKCDEAGFWELEGRKHRLKSAMGGLKAQALGTGFMEHAAQCLGHSRVTLLHTVLLHRERHNFRIPSKLNLPIFPPLDEKISEFSTREERVEALAARKCWGSWGYLSRCCYIWPYPLHKEEWFCEQRKLWGGEGIYTVTFAV